MEEGEVPEEGEVRGEGSGAAPSPSEGAAKRRWPEEHAQHRCRLQIIERLACSALSL